MCYIVNSFYAEPVFVLSEAERAIKLHYVITAMINAAKLRQFKDRIYFGCRVDSSSMKKKLL